MVAWPNAGRHLNQVHKVMLDVVGETAASREPAVSIAIWLDLDHNALEEVGHSFEALLQEPLRS